MIRRHPLAAYFTGACLLSWTLWAPLWLPQLGVAAPAPLPFQHPLGAAGPIVAAFVIAGLTEGGAGVSRLLRGMAAWRGRTVWLLVAALGPLAVLVLAVAIARLAGRGEASFAGFGVSREFPGVSAIGFFLYNVFTFGFGEETGWRGYALPQLQRRHGAFAATLLLTLGWAIWHAPLFLYRPGYAGMGPAGIAGWLLSLFTGALLLTWIFNGSRGSILAVALFHASVDVVFMSDIASPFVVNTAGTIVSVLGIAVLVLTGPRTLSWGRKVVAGGAG